MPSRMTVNDRAKREEPQKAPERFPQMTCSEATSRQQRWRTARLGLAALCTIQLMACDRFPQDPENTVDRIREQRIIRVGVEQPIPREARRLLAEIERATGAKAVISRNGVEPLLTKLGAGEIDLVIAPFGKETPWAVEAALSPPVRIDGNGKGATEWRAAMRTGENRWIMLVETSARRASSAPSAS